MVYRVKSIINIPNENTVIYIEGVEGSNSQSHEIILPNTVVKKFAQLIHNANGHITDPFEK